MAFHVIFIPGLGDNRPHGQDIAIKLWKLFGLTPHYFALGWQEDEGFSIKQNRLITKIESLNKQGHEVALVGVSAGASAAVNTFSTTDKISKIVLICGKINNMQTIGTKTYLENPDFEESMKHVDQSLQKLDQNKLANIMSIHPWHDQTVPVDDTIIKGATEKTLPGWSHLTGIGFGIILGTPSIAKFIRINS